MCADTAIATTAANDRGKGIFITILGNNSALPAFGRHPTAQVVTVNGQDVLLDCGEGTLMQLQVYNIRWARINHVFISHLHGDHYFGIFGLITSLSLFGRVAPFHIYAPAALEGLIQNMLSVANTHLCFPLHFHALPEGAALLVDEKTFSVSCFPVAHRIATHGFLVTAKTKGRKLLPEKARAYQIPTYFYQRLKAGEDYETKDGTIIKNEWVTEEGPHPLRYAYTADTVFTDSFLPYIAGVDCLYHESTYLSDNEEKAQARFHSTARQAAEIARRAGVRLLLLGHYSSRYQQLDAFVAEAREVFASVIATEEGRVYEVRLNAGEQDATAL